jgi:UPF0716 protein FxsA
MIVLLGLLYVVAELFTIVKVAEAIGPLNAIALLIVVSMFGAALAKRQGIHVLRRMQVTVAEGRVPSAEIVDAFLVLVAAFLMILPGFLSDGLALLLLIPPIRALVRGVILRRIRAGGRFVGVIPGGDRRGPDAAGNEIWDVEGWEEPPGPSDPPQQLGP